MKYKLIDTLRRLGLLQLADNANFWRKRLLQHRRNRQFIARHPDFPVPPEDLAFDAYNRIDWQAYLDSGLCHGGVFAQAIRAHCRPGPLSVLEWGCGPARLIRHLPQLLEDYQLRLVGSDYNPRTIRWCREHIPGIEFVENELLPPLPLEAASFDVAYNFSVFTHLSEAAQLAWAEEMWRVLKPGGVLLCSSHGLYYRYLLTQPEEIRRFEQGQVVVQGQVREGKKWFFAIHPPRYVTDVLLTSFQDVRQLPVDASTGMFQDLWIARKPLAADAPVAQPAHAGCEA